MKERWTNKAKYNVRSYFKEHIIVKIKCHIIEIINDHNEVEIMNGNESHNPIFKRTATISCEIRVRIKYKEE